jgi:hypothetical protein
MSEMEFLPKGKWKDWDYNGALKKGKVSRVGKFKNAQGLSLAFYSWEVPNPAGVVVFSHGHGVHATFELLNSKKPPGERGIASECTRFPPGKSRSPSFERGGGGR